jgi:hypothetical protein
MPRVRKVVGFRSSRERMIPRTVPRTLVQRVAEVNPAIAAVPAAAGQQRGLVD